MAYELYDNNFDKDINIINANNYSLVIGYTNECPRSRLMQNNLNVKSVSYGQINLRNNQQFLRKVAIKLNLTSVNMPLVLLYKNGKYVKRISNSLTIDNILEEVSKL
jgi:hypothetical protein